MGKMQGKKFNKKNLNKKAVNKKCTIRSLRKHATKNFPSKKKKNSLETFDSTGLLKKTFFKTIFFLGGGE